MTLGLSFALAVGTASILSTASCGSRCNRPCDFTTLESRFGMGSATVSLGNDPPRQRALTYSVSNYAPPDQCVVASLALTIAPNEQPSSPWGPVIMCRIGDDELRVFPHGLRDLRALAVGTRSVGTVAGDLRAVSSGSGCLVEGDSVGMTTVDVTRAEGGPAPYPALVTSDYVRELGAHVEARITRVVAGANCHPFSISADLTLTQTAADVLPNSGPLCTCS